MVLYKVVKKLSSPRVLRLNRSFEELLGLFSSWFHNLKFLMCFKKKKLNLILLSGLLGGLVAGWLADLLTCWLAG